MSVHRNRLIVVTFILSILVTGAGITGLILRIIEDKTGINLSYFSPGCNQVYSAIKFSYTYKSILVQFIANIVAVIFSLLVFMLLVCPLKAVATKKSQEESMNYEQPQQVTIREQALYITGSLVIFAGVILAGKAIEYIFEGKKCSVLVSINKDILNYIDMGIGGLAFILWCLLLALIAQRQPEVEQIKMQNFRSGAAERNEQEMARRIKQEVQGYLSQMEKEKEETKQGLLKYQQEVFGQNDQKNIYNNYKEQYSKDQPFNYSKKYNAHIKQQEIEGDSEYQYEYVVEQVSESQVDNYEEQMHQNKLEKVLQESSFQENRHQRQNNQDWSLSSPKKGYSPPNSLKAIQSKQTDNPMIKGVTQNSDASPTLKSLNGSNREASPVLKGANSMHQGSPKLKGTNQNKISTSPNLVSGSKGQNKLQEGRKFQLTKMTSSKILQGSNSPGQEEEQNQQTPPMERSGELINQQIKKILQVTLYHNFNGNPIENEPIQDHCPILKYVQKDQHYQINQSDYNFKGKKKNSYEKEQLVFCRKRKQHIGIKNQFDESATIREERIQLFGQKWAQQRQREQKQRSLQMSARFKKRNGLEAIRSKYCI